MHAIQLKPAASAPTEFITKSAYALSKNITYSTRYYVANIGNIVAVLSAQTVHNRHFSLASAVPVII